MGSRTLRHKDSSICREFGTPYEHYCELTSPQRPASERRHRLAQGVSPGWIEQGASPVGTTETESKNETTIHANRTRHRARSGNRNRTVGCNRHGRCVARDRHSDWDRDRMDDVKEQKNRTCPDVAEGFLARPLSACGFGMTRGFGFERRAKG